MGENPKINKPEKVKSVHQRRGHLPHKKELYPRSLPKHQWPVINNRPHNIKRNLIKPSALKIPVKHLFRQTIINLQTIENSHHHNEDKR